MRWPFFFSLASGWYLLTNTIFALGYLACGPTGLGSSVTGMENHTFLRAFFFSVQTLSTIGYGHVVPIGLPANVIVTLESLVGLLGFAITTGLLFSRFSRPTANILFSRHGVIAPYQNMTAFEFRVANARSNELIEVSAKVMLTRFEDVDGVRTRRYYPLDLERPKVTFLPLTWTVVHPIDERSPLHGETAQTLRDSSTEFLVLLSGFDRPSQQRCTPARRMSRTKLYGARILSTHSWWRRRISLPPAPAARRKWLWICACSTKSNRQSMY